jgi:hypothetical protein
MKTPDSLMSKAKGVLDEVARESGFDDWKHVCISEPGLTLKLMKRENAKVARRLTVVAAELAKRDPLAFKSLIDSIRMAPIYRPEPSDLQ